MLVSEEGGTAICTITLSTHREGQLRTDYIVLDSSNVALKTSRATFVQLPCQFGVDVIDECSFVLAQCCGICSSVVLPKRITKSPTIVELHLVEGVDEHR